jgi:NADPH:quinone reductase
VRWVAWGAFLDVAPELMGVAAASLTEMFADGFVAPQIASQCAFDELPDALGRLGRGEIRGKLVAAAPAAGG